jgi:hypothetical protein
MALFHLQESLQKLESLDVKRVFPCHGRPFSDIKKTILRGKNKIERYLLDRELIGNDLIKKIIVYTLLMRNTIKEDDLFPYLMNTYWFKETVDFYFNNEYEMISYAANYTRRTVFQRVFRMDIVQVFLWLEFRK